jgi:hypothetical protein
MTMKRAVPPRIALYAAETVPVVVAILRVRSKWWHVVRIDEQGQVERGSWFKGAKIMLDQCSLNHDGTMFAYLATTNAHGGWSGLCHPPWLRCLAQIHEPMPFMASCAFGFAKPGEITLQPSVSPFALSEDDKRVIEATIQPIVGAEGFRQIIEKMKQDKAKQRDDWSRSAATISEELRISIVKPGVYRDRMAGQGFVRCSGGWTWTGRDGTARVVSVERFGDSNPAILDTLNCCVDALGRWWQALDGVITCHGIEKSGARLVFSIDTKLWTPPLRNIEGQEP